MKEITQTVDDNFKEVPNKISQKNHGIDIGSISQNAIFVVKTLKKAGYSGFIVGGAVRDLLLGIVPKDFDIATNATPEQVIRMFRRARVIGRRFQIAHIQFGSELIEVSTFRGFSNNSSSTASLEHEKIDSTFMHTHRFKKKAFFTFLETNHHIQPSLQNRNDHYILLRSNAYKNYIYKNSNSIIPHAIAKSGRVLRDNVWGKQHEDAKRRDLTINAMYYDPINERVLDYYNGFADIRSRVVRMIGEPIVRYREDPIRMLRVVRLGAKLGFTIDPATREPIGESGHLLLEVPHARLFDEILKLLLSGHAQASVERLREEGLETALIPTLPETMADPIGGKLVTLALKKADERILSKRKVSPSFLFASLLWIPVQNVWHSFIARGESSTSALYKAINQVMDQQFRKLTIYRRFVEDMKEIWILQKRLEKRPSCSSKRLLEYQKFKAAYDFLLLRAEAGEIDATMAKWWINFVEGDLEKTSIIY